MPETCNSRHFSWLVKSCFPYPNINPHQPQPHSPSAAANYRQRSRNTTAASLPDDVILECLSRVPATSLPAVSLVCRRWSRILNSVSFTFLRRRLGLLRPTIFAVSDSPQLAASHCLGDGGQEGADKWKLTAFPACCDAVLAHSRVVAVGRRIYVLGRNVVLRYDTWTGTVSERAPMLFARKKFASAEIAGKIYVAGGSSRTAAVEVYDPATDGWRVVTEAPRKRYGCIGASVDGVFYVIGGLKIGYTWDAPPPRSQDALVYARSMDIYDAEEGAWLRSRIVPGGGCVVAACAAAGRVYVLASHALELTVWRFDGRRKGASFGEWSRIRSPPLPPQVRLDSSVRFSCVGVGDKVVLVQVLGCIDDLLRRSGRTVRGLREGLVLVYDTTGEEWKRGADLPEVIRRAACVCVEC